MSIQDDLDVLRSLNGLHMGLLDEKEMDSFERLRQAGMAQRDYSGPSGFLGLARLRLTEVKDDR